LEPLPKSPELKDTSSKNVEVFSPKKMEIPLIKKDEEKLSPKEVVIIPPKKEVVKPLPPKAVIIPSKPTRLPAAKLVKKVIVIRNLCNQPWVLHKNGGGTLHLYGRDSVRIPPSQLSQEMTRLSKQNKIRITEEVV